MAKNVYVASNRQLAMQLALKVEGKCGPRTIVVVPGGYSAGSMMGLMGCDVYMHDDLYRNAGHREFCMKIEHECAIRMHTRHVVKL